jgi:hypothetical protein
MQEGGTIKISKASHFLGVDPKTIQRYVLIFQEVHQTHQEFPIIKLDGYGKHKVITISEKTYFKTIFQYLSTYISYLFLKKLDSNILSSFFYDIFEDFHKKFHRSNESFSNIQKIIYYQTMDLNPYIQKEEILDKIIKSLSFKRMIHFEYQKNCQNSLKITQFLPWFITIYKNKIYILGVIHRNFDQFQPTHCFLLDHIQKIEIETVKNFYETPKSFNINEYYKNHFGVFVGQEQPQDIEMTFHGCIISQIQELHWPGFQRWSEDESGKIILHCKATWDKEFIYWILSWGEKIQVLKPKKLIDQIAQQQINSIKKYYKDIHIDIQEEEAHSVDENP